MRTTREGAPERQHHQAVAVTRVNRVFASLVLALTVMVSHQTAAAAGPAPVDLLSTANFAILSGAAITSTGGGIINGDVGASPISGSAIGVTQPQVNGTIYAVDSLGPAGSIENAALLTTAKGDLTSAYIYARDLTPVPVGPFLNPGGGNIGGLVLVPGLYKFTTQASITGADVILLGGPNDVWIFQIGTNLIVGANGRQVVLAGGARAENVFWQVGTSATIGTFASFKGTIMADQSITLDTGSTLEGRALAFEGMVTFNGSSAGLLQNPYLDISVDPSGATLADNQETSFVVTGFNIGEVSAENAALSFEVPSGITVTGAESPNGVPSFSPGGATLDAGTLGVSESTSMTVTVLSACSGVFESTATLTALVGETTQTVFRIVRITVTDLTSPTITCPANITVNSSPGTCDAVVTFPDPDVSDNCPGVGLPVSFPPSGSTFPVGDTTVVATVTDATDNVSTCSFTVTVVDNERPVSAATAPTGPLSQVSPIVSIFYNASDNCGLTGVQIWYRKDGIGGYVQYGGVFVASPVAFDTSLTGGDGTYEVYTVAIDIHGNTEFSPESADIVFWLDRGSDLSVTKSASPDPVNVGQTLTYLIVVTNNGPKTAFGVLVDDTLPPGVEYVSAVPSAGNCAQTTGQLLCDLGSMLPGTTATVQLVMIPGTPGIITNTVTVSLPENGDLVPENNVATVSTLVNEVEGGADLAIVKTADTAVVQAGNSFNYIIQVTNSGPDSATSVAVTDTIPSGISITGFAATVPATCSGSSGTFVCDLGTLAPGATLTLTLTAIADATSSGPIQNVAVVSSPDPDPVTGNNTSAATVTVEAGPQSPVDLVVTKTDSRDPAYTGRELIYTVVVHNNGTYAATNVSIADLLPPEVTYVSATVNSGNCNINQTTVTCIVPVIASGANAIVTITVVPVKSGTITNTASAFAANQVELNPADNTARETTLVNPVPVPCIDLTGSWGSSVLVTCKTVKGRLSCQVKFPFSVTNLCTDTQRKNHCFRVAFYLSDDKVFDDMDRPLGYTSFQTIKAGATVTRTFKKRVPPNLTLSGKYIIAIIDHKNWVPEDFDRSNNAVVFGPIQ